MHRNTLSPRPSLAAKTQRSDARTPGHLVIMGLSVRVQEINSVPSQRSKNYGEERCDSGKQRNVQTRYSIPTPYFVNLQPHYYSSVMLVGDVGETQVSKRWRCEHFNLGLLNCAP